MEEPEEEASDEDDPADDPPLVPELEPPVVAPPEEPLELPDEGAGGEVTEVSVTTGSDEEPAVVATEPYSRAPISQILPRSKLL